MHFQSFKRAQQTQAKSLQLATIKCGANQEVAAGIDQLQTSLATGAGQLAKVTDYTNGVAQMTAGANTLSIVRIVN